MVRGDIASKARATYMTGSLKSKLTGGEPTLGSWITLGNSSVAEILAKAGFDWLVVDLEHSTMSIADAGELIRTIDLCGVTPLVRLTSNDANQVKRVMDCGAHGIVVPMINSADEALRAVAATRYPPHGTRGVGLGRAQGYGVRFAEYLKWQVREVVVIAQIEHHSAVKEIDSILAVDGVDGFIVGPYDLSCSMGIPGQFDRPEFVAALEKIKLGGVRAHKPGGLHIVEPDPERLAQAEAEGYLFNAYSVDFRFLDVSARNGVAKFRGSKH
jgi:2-dehydro-3-deoxyglucarate aldolase